MRQTATLKTLSLTLLGRLLSCVLGYALSAVVASSAMAAPSAKIIGGVDATVDAPWMSGLHLYFPAEDSYSIRTFCGGSLIAPGWVVTAAHCVDGDTTADQLLLRVDNPDLGPIDSPPIPAENQPQHVVTTLTVHPSYSHFLNGFDIALLQLETPSDATQVSIADQSLMDSLNIISNTANAVDVLGWGVYDGDGTNFDPDNAGDGPRPRLLQQATLDFLPRSQYRGDPIANNIVLAQKLLPQIDQPNGVDSCFGDSGGPLFVPANRAIGTLTSSSDQLVGITSFGNNQCNSASEPGGYTRVASYTDWIESVTFSEGDPLSDLRIDVNSNHHDIVPSSEADFSVTVFNDSSRNDVAGFSIRLETNSNDTSLVTKGDASLSCSNAGSTTLHCDSTDTLAAQASVTYDFGVHDQKSLVRTASVNATITAQANDDYRLANNRHTFEINYTDGADLGISIENVNLVYGKFDIVLRNESDFFSANNVAVTFTSNIALEWSDNSECIASSDFSVTCTTDTLAPLDEINRTITLPQNPSLTLFYDIDVSVSHDGTDNNGTNDSDSKSITVLPKNQRPVSLASSSSAGGGSITWLTVLCASLLTLRLRSRCKEAQRASIEALIQGLLIRAIGGRNKRCKPHTSAADFNV